MMSWVICDVKKALSRAFRVPEIWDQAEQKVQQQEIW